MKNHVREEIRYFDLEMPVAFLTDRLMELVPSGAVEPRLEARWAGYDGGSDYVIVYWRPMTEKEQEQAKKRRAQVREARKAAKLKQEQEEREQYLRLKEKFE